MRQKCYYQSEIVGRKRARWGKSVIIIYRSENKKRDEEQTDRSRRRQDESVQERGEGEKLDGGDEENETN